MALLHTHALDDFSHHDDWHPTLDGFAAGDSLLDFDFSSSVNFDLPTPPASEACSPLHSPGPSPPFADNAALSLFASGLTINIKTDLDAHSPFVFDMSCDLKSETELESEEDLPLTPKSEKASENGDTPVKAEPQPHGSYLLTMCPELSLPPSPLLDLPTEGVELLPGAEGIPPMQVFQPQFTGALPQWPHPAMVYAPEEDSEDDIDVVTVDPFPAVLALKRPFSYDTTFGASNPSLSMYTLPEPLMLGSPESKRLRTDSSSSTATSSTGGRRRKAGGSVEQQAKRDMHNSLERRRREDLKASFDGLRWVLPHLDPNDKVPKQVTVLNGAADHIRLLRERQRQLLEARHALFLENQRLREHVANAATKTSS